MRHTLQQKDLALIHGPPGTGKTRTLVEIIRQELRDWGKVLFAAASNTAVDNMAERLTRCGVNIIRWRNTRRKITEDNIIVRLGNPAKATEKIQKFTLEYILCDDFTLLKDLQYKAKKAQYGGNEYEGKIDLHV